jgi:hypothetical protein
LYKETIIKKSDEESKAETSLYIEDDGARIKVQFSDTSNGLIINHFVSGIVVALKYSLSLLYRGKVSTGSSNVLFITEDYAIAGLPEQKNKIAISPLNSKLMDKRRRLIAFVSGLEVDSQWKLYHEKLYRFLAGEFGSVDTMNVIYELKK